jgi:hypothetical protein
MTSQDCVALSAISNACFKSDGSFLGVLVESAAREIGDEALPARLSIRAGVAGLGPYGRHLISFPTLGSPNKGMTPRASNRGE